MNLLTILFLGSTALSGLVTLCVGLVNLPQPSTTYIQGSGENAQTVAEKNRLIIISSLAFKETMIGTGLLILFIISLSWVKYREEQQRIKDEQSLEQLKLKMEPQNKSPVQQLAPKSAELDSKTKQEPVNKPIKAEPVPVLKPQNPVTVSVSNPDTVLNIHRQPTYPRPILKQVGFTSIKSNVPVTNPYPYYPRPYYPRPYYPRPRPYDTLYAGYNKPVIQHIKY